jgi:DNA-directed RNA polymerase subunit omega
MARVTIEDCLEKVDDRFELVALAAQRARNISSGAALTIERKGEKDTVISLREIAEGSVEIDPLKTDLVKSFQKEKDRFDDFVAPANNNDSIEIDAEEADIAAAIAEATEAGQETDEEMEGFNTTGSDQVFAGENIETND